MPKTFLFYIALCFLVALASWQHRANIFHFFFAQPSSVNPSSELVMGFLKTTQQHHFVDIDPKQAQWGQSFFFDPGFSRNAQVSCATCHQPEKSFSDSLRFAKGLRETNAHTPTLLNLADQNWFFWDGRSDNLLSQSVHPIEHPHEHGWSRTQVLRRLFEDYPGFLSPQSSLVAQKIGDLKAAPPPSQSRVSLKIAGYILYSMQDLGDQMSVLRQASPTRSPAAVMQDRLYTFSSSSLDLSNIEISELEALHKAWIALDTKLQDDINRAYLEFARALASFQLSIRTQPSAFDDFARNSLESGTLEPTTTFSSEHIEGLKIFLGKGQCHLCHFGPNLSDNQFHNTGISSALMRAQGLLIARDDPLNCLKGLAPSHNKESCLELEWLDEDNIELVGAVRTPTLRNLKDSAPYFHDGHAASLDDVIRFYSELKTPAKIGHREESLQPFTLTNTEHDQLKMFLMSLSSPIRFHGSK